MVCPRSPLVHDPSRMVSVYVTGNVAFDIVNRREGSSVKWNLATTSLEDRKDLTGCGHRPPRPRRECSRRLLGARHRQVRQQHRRHLRVTSRARFLRVRMLHYEQGHVSPSDLSSNNRGGCPGAPGPHGSATAESGGNHLGDRAVCARSDHVFAPAPGPLQPRRQVWSQLVDRTIPRSERSRTGFSGRTADALGKRDPGVTHHRIGTTALRYRPLERDSTP